MPCRRGTLFVVDWRTQARHQQAREEVTMSEMETAGAPFKMWGIPGQDFDEPSIAQLRNACQLPVAAAGALMPDAHVGYGLPIGGVLATRGAVVPYAVGVDIAC